MEAALTAIPFSDAVERFDARWRRANMMLIAWAEHGLSRSAAWACAVLALLALQCYLAVIHHAWMDEWQALLIALQSPDWPHLLQNLRYEGHPPLWYAILRTLAVFLPPPMILTVAQLAIALGTQIAIFGWTAFSRTERLLIGLSYFVLIEFGTVSRSLSFGVLLTVLFFRARETWLKWTIIVLLPLVDFQFGLISIVAIALMIREGRWSYVGAGTWILAAMVAAWCVQPAPDMIPALDTKAPHLELLRGLIALSSMLVPLHYMQDQWHWAGALPPAIGIALGLAFLAFMFRHLQHDLIAVALMFGFVAINFLFTAVVYPLAVRHWTLVPLTFILLVGWTRVKGHTHATKPSFQAWLFVAALAGLWGTALNITRPFDSGHQAAAFIKRQGLQDKHWVAWPDINGPVPAAILERDIHNLGSRCAQSFIRWNYRSPIKTRTRFEQELRQVSNQYGRFYLISDQNVARVVSKGFVKRIAAFEPGYNGQIFQLFVVNPDAPESALRPHACVPGLRPLSEVFR